MNSRDRNMTNGTRHGYAHTDDDTPCMEPAWCSRAHYSTPDNYAREQRAADRAALAARPVGDLDKAADAVGAWLLENVGEGAAHDALCELHLDTWKEAAEVAIRAGRGEFDHRPFTMRPGLQR